MTRTREALTVAAAALFAAACATAPRTAAPAPASGGGDHVTHAGADEDGRVRDGYTLADVRFMQHMIGHHAQALVMAELVPDRTSRPEMLLLAERITVSQQDEIAQMQRWLRARNEEVPPPDAHVHAAMGHGQLMPGMLTQQELDALARASGSAFDRLFLELMIKHHDGALVMVRDLFRQPGAGQEAELFVLAADVEADQTAEIRRMRMLLDRLPPADRR